MPPDENRVVRSRGRDRMKFGFPRGAADGPAIRITPKRGADVRTSFTPGCAARCCSGRSLKCQPAPPLNQMTTSVRVQPATLAGRCVREHPGPFAWQDGRRLWILDGCETDWVLAELLFDLGRADTSKSAAQTIGGRARRLAPCLAERSWEDPDERKRQRADSPRGS